MQQGDPSDDKEKPQAPEGESALTSSGARSAAGKRARSPRRGSKARTRSQDSTEQESDLPDTLEDAIAIERTQLMDIQALARCLYKVLLYADDDDALAYADVANVAARLSANCNHRLELISNRFGKDSTRAQALE